MLRRLLLACLLALWTPVLAHAQTASDDEDAGDKSSVVRFLENQISTPDRRIRIGRLDGPLSSDVRAAFISIADRQGVWLRIDNVHLVWSRLALFRRRLDVSLLEASAITVTRPPLPAEGVQPAADPIFSIQLPELPVSVKLDRLTVPEVTLGPTVPGGPAKLFLDGGINLDSGVLDSHLTIRRLDGAGGQLAVQAGYSNKTKRLDLDLSLVEGQNGLVSNLLDLQGRPALRFGVKGSGPLDNFAADISLAANDQALLSGKATLTQSPGGRRFVADVNGALQRLVPSTLSDFFEGSSALSLQITDTAAGIVTLDRFNVTSGVLALQGSAALSADGFPTRIDLTGKLASPDGKPVQLPGNSDSTLGSTTFVAHFGGDTPAWAATLDLRDLHAQGYSVGHADLRVNGTAANLDDAARRSLTFELDGQAEGLQSPDPAVARALGSTLQLAATGNWHAGAPVAVDGIRLSNASTEANFKGQVAGTSLDGTYSLAARNLAAFAGLAGRPLRGALSLSATGRLGLVGGTFDLALDGRGTDLSVGEASLDPLLRGPVTLKGGVARSVDGLTLRALALAGRSFSTTLDGSYGRDAVALTVAARLAELGLLTQQAQGAASLDARIEGPLTGFHATARLASDRLVLRGKPLTGATASFEGTVGGPKVDGALLASGRLGDLPVSLAARLASPPDGSHRLDGLAARVGDTTLTGGIAVTPDVRVTGNVALHSPDLSVVAPLLLVDASGSVDVNAVLSAPAGGGQDAALTARATRLRVQTLRLDSADIALDARDVLRVPSVEGHVRATGLAVGTFEVRSIDANASRQGSATAFSAESELAQGHVSTAGSLTPAGVGYDVALDRLSLNRRPDLAVALAAPVTVAVRGKAVTVPRAELRVTRAGAPAGDVTLEGTLADTLALDATIAGLPLNLADAVVPSLALGGTLSGQAHITGTTADPAGSFTLHGAGLTAAPLRTSGVAPLDLDTTGTLADRRVALRASVTGGSGLSARAAGTLPLQGEGLDLTVDLASLPVAAANGFVPGLGLAGTLTGQATVTGSLAAPQGRFDLRGSGLSTAALRQAKVPPLALTANGTLAQRTAAIQAALTGAGGLAARVNGTVPLEGDGLSLHVDLASLPLALGNSLGRDLGLAGTLSGKADLTGSLADPQGPFSLRGSGLTAAALRRARVPALTLAADGTLANRTATVRASLGGGGGLSLRLDGAVPFEGSGLDLRADLASLPLALGNAAAPDLGLAGTLSGQASVTGSLTDPQGRFSLRGTGLTAAPLRRARVAPLSLSADGTLAERTATVRASLGGAGGVSLRLDGTVPFEGSGLSVNATLASLPVALANGFSPGLGAAGTISGQASVTGSLADPQGRFTLRGTGLTAAPLRQGGVTPLTLAADGTLAQRRVTTQATLSGGGGIALRAEGTVPLEGEGLVVSIRGGLPLAIANGFLRARADRVTGQLRVDARVSGSLAAPRVDGTATVSGGTFTDPETTTTLTGINGTVRLAGTEAVIERLTATTKGGGTLALRARLGFAPGSNLPVDATLTLRGAQVTDGQIVRATLSGAITLRGPLLAGPTVGGTVTIDQADVTIPERFPGGSTLLDVRHRRPSRAVARTLVQVRKATAPPAKGGFQASNIRLALTIRAPGNVHLGGRGLDAELGGQVRLAGTVGTIQPTGAFELRRGRLTVIGQEIRLERGTVTLVGNLDPTIDFRATSQGNGVTVTFALQGPASDPQIVLSSSPSLPQDEILAQFLFGHSIAELTPFQIARLATAVAQLSGTGGGDILGGIGQATGLGALDIGSDASGNPALRLGRSLGDRAHLTVLTGPGGVGAGVDLDITKNLKARAETGTQGGKAGLYYEREY